MRLNIPKRLHITIIFVFFSILLQQQAFANQQLQKSAFGFAKKNPFILTGTIYYIPNGTNRLPDFSKLTPAGKIYTAVLNITPRKFDKGFPGVTNRFEWFAIDYKGKIYIPKDKTYTFSLLSDDGSKLIIDGKVVIDNGGLHPPREKTGKVHLKRGIHEIEVPYFQGPRWQVALVLWIIKKGRKELFNMKDFALVKIKESKKLINITLNSAVLFDFDSYRLKLGAKATLNTILDFLKSYTYKRIIIEGHTDDIGSKKYNLKLSLQRANAVARYLIRHGIPRSKIKTIGYGETRPKYPNTSEENRRKNRRVEIKIIKK